MKRGSERGSFRASGAIVAAACDDGASYLIGKFRQSPPSLSSNIRRPFMDMDAAAAGSIGIRRGREGREFF